MTPFCIKFKRYYIWGVFLRFARKAPEVGIFYMAHDYAILEVIITNIPVHVFCLYTKSYIIAVRYVFHKKSGQKIALGQLLQQIINWFIAILKRRITQLNWVTLLWNWKPCIHELILNILALEPMHWFFWPQYRINITVHIFSSVIFIGTFVVHWQT